MQIKVMAWHVQDVWYPPHHKYIAVMHYLQTERQQKANKSLYYNYKNMHLSKETLFSSWTLNTEGEKQSCEANSACGVQ